MKHRIAVIAGDGIGPEVIEAAIPILDRVAARHDFALQWERLPFSADHYLKTKETLPAAALEHLRNDVDAILLGALGDPRVPGNAIDFVIFRENTEGQYLGRGRSSGDEHVAEEVNTGRGVERIIRAAFDCAAKHGKTRVTMSDKSNAIPTHRIWQERFKAIAKDYNGITAEHRYVDALALELVREPERFQVIVTNNLYGDILSDLGAGLVGGLGVAASANLHPGKRHALFEPVHGSAPGLVGKGVANPVAAVLTGALMFEHLGHPAAAADLKQAVRTLLGTTARTPDLGGDSTTAAVVNSHGREGSACRRCRWPRFSMSRCPAWRVKLVRSSMSWPARTACCRRPATSPRSSDSVHVIK